MDVIKVIIADDHLLFREGLKRILSLEKDILVIGEAASFDETIQVCAGLRPDILFLDLKMPVGDVAEALRKIAEKSPATKAIILTAYSEVESVLSTARARARAYVLKGISVPTLLDAIHKVHAGEIWVDPELPSAEDFSRIARKLLMENGAPFQETPYGLTKREIEILQLVAEGLSNEEIGKKIFISRKTVKTHLANIFDKLQVNNRFKAALWIMPHWKKRRPDK